MAAQTKAKPKTKKTAGTKAKSKTTTASKAKPKAKAKPATKSPVKKAKTATASKTATKAKKVAKPKVETKLEPVKLPHPSETMAVKKKAYDAVLALWVAYKKEPQRRDLRNQLVELYQPIVRRLAERIKSTLPDGVELDDMISAGVFGLMDAIDAFDLERGVKFETYCTQRIRGSIIDELRAMDWVPRLIRHKASQLEATKKELTAKLGRPPEVRELANYLGLTISETEKIIYETNAVALTSLNRHKYDSDSSKAMSEIDRLEDKKSDDPTGRAQKNDVMRLVTKGLSRNEKLIVILYYYEELTMKEIGLTLDLSESRVSQMHSTIVNRLKGLLKEREPEFAA